MYTCKCGRSFEKKNSYVAHCGHCEINLGRKPKDRFGESRSTKTPSRVKALSECFNKSIHNSDSIYKRLINGSKYLSEDTECFVYLVKFNNECKVGFTTNLYNRIHKLGNPKIISLIRFDNLSDGLKFELNFHETNKSRMIRNEYYPLSYLKIFEAQFITYNQFMA